MTITKNLGGDRLGSGNKMNVSMHNFERSTHDLSKIWRSSMSCGTLVPFLQEYTLPGDTFDINLNTMIRTLPTLAPLFGSFKIQLDVFSVPIRLYNAQLHMNRLGVGMKMSQVKFPLMKCIAKGSTTKPTAPDKYDQSCLLAYLGVRGAPIGMNSSGQYTDDFGFRKNALGLLAYWDIYKNYYANKQQEIGYMVSNSNFMSYAITAMAYEDTTWHGIDLNYETGVFNTPLNTTFNKISIQYSGILDTNDLKIQMSNIEYPIKAFYNVMEYFTVNKMSETIYHLTPNFDEQDWTIYSIVPIKTTTTEDKVILKSFPLENIDNTQLAILQHSIDTPYEINEITGINPYINCIGTNYPNNYYTTYFSQNGLGIKTYQSDIFNNWLNTDWIDGDNGISEITAIDTSGSMFTLDALNLAQKVYDMLNRVAVSGGSYQDWQEAIYGETAFRMAESPIYCGGLSTELIFEEVISTADATTTDGEVPLGSLAGRGTQSQKRKGGNIVIKTTEPSIIMGIVSITPRIDYSQGNKWFTRLKTMDDLHKPSLDGIGFQELITEDMAHWDCKYISDTGSYIYRSAGKQPAWINYMTSYNEVFGHFAEKEGNDALMQTVLNRQYEFDTDTLGIKDLTTYVDPTKYNYAFASTDLSAQNFWVQIACDITARRKMSAKIIPNL